MRKFVTYVVPGVKSCSFWVTVVTKFSSLNVCWTSCQTHDFLSDHPHNISSIVQILWPFIAINNCWSAIPVMRKCDRTTSNTKPNVVTLSHWRISKTPVFGPQSGSEPTSCTVFEVLEFRKHYVARKRETTCIYLTMMVISEIICRRFQMNELSLPIIFKCVGSFPYVTHL